MIHKLVSMRLTQIENPWHAGPAGPFRTGGWNEGEGGFSGVLAGWLVAFIAMQMASTPHVATTQRETYMEARWEQGLDAAHRTRTFFPRLSVPSLFSFHPIFSRPLPVSTLLSLYELFHPLLSSSRNPLVSSCFYFIPLSQFHLLFCLFVHSLSSSFLGPRFHVTRTSFVFGYTSIPNINRIDFLWSYFLSFRMLFALPNTK